MLRVKLSLLLALLPLAAAAQAELNFKMQEIETSLGIGYAVRLVDVDGDKRRDIVVVDKDRILWYPHGQWRPRPLLVGQTEADNVCIAPHDIDADGRLDFFLGAHWSLDTENSGTIYWLQQGQSPADAWKLHPIGREPTTHRMRVADITGDGKNELIVVPLFGPGTKGPAWDQAGVRILAYEIPEDPVAGPWKAKVLSDELHVCHNFYPTDFDSDGDTDILVASFEGVTLLERGEQGEWSGTLIGTGNQETVPKRGASEVKPGKLADGTNYIATIEPWHGFQVIVYTPPNEGGTLWKRTVLDEDLQWGHAVWPVNLDDDDDQELVIGVRDNKNKAHRSGVRIYDPQKTDDGIAWKRQLVDPGGVAVEDLACADLNGDGKVDIVAVGRQTKNVRIYWNEGTE